MIDLHSHILPGVDDGAADLAASLEIARASVADGIAALAATPHVRADFPTSAERMASGVEAVRAALAEEGIPLQLLPGGELALDRLLELDDAELRRFGLGGNEGALLLEFPYHGWPLALEEVVVSLGARGFRVVLAHPERNGDVQARPERLSRAVAAGALVQLTAASVDGRLDRASRAAAFRLLDLELAHLVASDAHAPAVRGAGMTAAATAVGEARLARWLTVEVPRAIVDGSDLPPRPERLPPARRLPWRRK